MRELFFVISGLLITGLLIAEQKKTGSISLKGFYIRRTLRIFPAYFVFLGVMALYNTVGLVEVPTLDFVHAVTYAMNYAPDFGTLSPSAACWRWRRYMLGDGTERSWSRHG